jgi:hypothetical protein
MTRAIHWLTAVFAMLAPASAGAQVFGTFAWQMQPYCNRVTLTLTNTAGGFTVGGSDDRCGAAEKGSASGVAVFNADGTVGLNFTILTPPSGQAVNVSARVSPTTGLGTWSDEVGNAGTFAFGANTLGLPARPTVMAPIDVAEAPNQPADPCDVPTARPTLVLCGTSTFRWRNGGFGLPGVQVWRDKDGSVHIRGSATRSGGAVVGGVVFILPPSMIPARTLGVSVGTGMTAGAHAGGTALLVIYGPDVPGAEGMVAVFSPSTSGHSVIHLGEVVFSIDR